MAALCMICALKHDILHPHNVQDKRVLCNSISSYWLHGFPPLLHADAQLVYEHIYSLQSATDFLVLRSNDSSRACT